MTSHTDPTGQSRIGRIANVYAKAHGHMEVDDADTWQAHLSGIRAVIAAIDGQWSDVIGEGDNITAPAMTPSDFSDLWADVSRDASEHQECPEWCDVCEQWEKPRSCSRCAGSGCGPGTALGAYEECQDCAGDGRSHAKYTLSAGAPLTDIRPEPAATETP